jgi:hypothetical protein
MRCLYSIVFTQVLYLSSAHQSRNNDVNVNALRISPTYSGEGTTLAKRSSQLFDLASASKCYQEWDQYKARKSADLELPKWKFCHPSTTLSSSDYVPYTGTTIFQTFQRVGPGSVYRDCDGFTRFRFDPKASISTVTSFITKVHRGWEIATSLEDCDVPYIFQPSCEVPEEFCKSLWKSYRAHMATFSEMEPFQTVRKPWAPCGAPGNCVLNLKDDVVLIHWPAKISTTSKCNSGVQSGPLLQADGHPHVATITTIKFSGKDIYRKFWISENRTMHWPNSTVTGTILTGFWVVTSPTILLAHRPIVRTLFVRPDGGNAHGNPLISKHSTIRPAGVITLSPQDVYSVRPLIFRSGNLDEARSIAHGKWRPEPGQLVAGEKIPLTTLPFNFGNLVNPVPASVYFDDMDHCWGEQTYCATLTDDSYHPQIVIARHIWRSLLGDSNACGLPILIDPAVTATVFERFSLAPADLPSNVPSYPTADSQTEARNQSPNSQPELGIPSPIPKVFNEQPKQTPGPISDSPGNALNQLATSPGRNRDNGADIIDKTLHENVDKEAPNRPGGVLPHSQFDVPDNEGLLQNFNHNGAGLSPGNIPYRPGSDSPQLHLDLPDSSYPLQTFDHAGASMLSGNVAYHPKGDLSPLRSDLPDNGDPLQKSDHTGATMSRGNVASASGEDFWSKKHTQPADVAGISKPVSQNNSNKDEEIPSTQSQGPISGSGSSKSGSTSSSTDIRLTVLVALYWWLKQV